MEFLGSQLEKEWETDGYNIDNILLPTVLLSHFSLIKILLSILDKKIKLEVDQSM